MGVVQVQLPDHLKRVIERQVAKAAPRMRLISSRRPFGFTPTTWRWRTRSSEWSKGLTPIRQPGAT